MSSKGAKKKVALVQQADAYFRDLVTGAMNNQRVTALPETEFYLVQLLRQFMTTDRMFPRDGSGQYQDQPLALRIQEALSSPSVELQRQLLRHIGDVSLYLSGYFPESLLKKCVDLNYYISIGESAYSGVSKRVEENLVRQMYSELARKFSEFVTVLAEVSAHTGQKDDQTLLKMLETWEKTKSEKAAFVLKDAGLIPSPKSPRKSTVQ